MQPFRRAIWHPFFGVLTIIVPMVATITFMFLAKNTGHIGALLVFLVSMLALMLCAYKAGVAIQRARDYNNGS